jgi:hypothetical protein
MLIYLLKANIVLVLFYLAYRFGLRRLTFYTLNRFFLIAGIMCAAVGPLIDPSIFIQQHHGLNVVAESLPDLSMFKPHEEPLINVILEYIFWGGVTVMVMRLMVQLLSLLELHRKTTKTAYGEEHLRVTERHVNPFSFMRNIYINPSLHSPEELSSVIRHELVHVRQWHTLDVLLGEVTKIFYWFNPGAWLMSVAIRENLEFITDRYILQQGMDAKAYQYSLIKVSGIPYATAIANNFNFSHLKQRIMMMNKKRSSRYHLVRYVVLGTIMGIAVLSLNFTRAAVTVETSAVNIASMVFQKDTTKPAAVQPPFTTPPPPPPAQPAPPPPPAPAKGKGKIPPPPPPAPAAPAAPAKPVVEVVKMESVETPVSSDMAAPVDASVPDERIEDPSNRGIALRKGTPASTTPLFFVDDVRIGRKSPDYLSSEEISSINVYKGETAVNIYGPEGKDGVIMVYTKRYKGEPIITKSVVPAKPSTPGTVQTVHVTGPVNKDALKTATGGNDVRIEVAKPNATTVAGQK